MCVSVCERVCGRGISSFEFIICLSQISQHQIACNLNLSYYCYFVDAEDIH